MHLELNEGPTDFDIPHNFTFSGTALVPHTYGLNLSWVARALSGTPFSLTNAQPRPGSQRHPGRAAAGGRLLRHRQRRLHREELQGRAQRRARARLLPGATCGSATASTCSGRRRLEVVRRRVQPDQPHELREPVRRPGARASFLVLTAYSTSYTPRKAADRRAVRVLTIVSTEQCADRECDRGTANAITIGCAAIRAIRGSPDSLYSVEMGPAFRRLLPYVLRYRRAVPPRAGLRRRSRRRSSCCRRGSSSSPSTT